MKRLKIEFNQLFLRFRKYFRKLLRLETLNRNQHRQNVIKRHLDRIGKRMAELDRSIRLASFGTMLVGGVFLAIPASAQTFTEVSGTPFVGVDEGSVATADVDNDGDIDIFIVGRISTGVYISELYENDGSGVFTKNEASTFAGIAGTTAFSDVDRDGDPDILITGFSDPSGASKLYVNNGSGVFTEDTGVPFDQARFSSLAAGDVNNDGADEVLIIGVAQVTGTSTFQTISKLYSNDGSGNFEEVAGTPFLGVDQGDIEFADVDGDDNLDVLIIGNDSSTPTTKLYINDGAGSFIEKTGNPFSGLSSGAAAFGDIDNDGDDDILLTGRDGTNGAESNKITGLYKNDGSGNFTEVTENPFPDVYLSDVAFSDVDTDGDLDVMIIGRDVSFQRHADIFINDGSGTFSEFTSTPFDIVYTGSVDFVNVDGDRDEDVIITGSNITFQKIAKLYLNDVPPEFESESVISFTENATEVVVDINANDGDGFVDDEGITYILESTGDGSLFTVNSLNGEISFISSPDFENPSDAGNDNEYVINVSASDGPNTTTQMVAISVEDANDLPAISDQSFTLDESSEVDTLVGTVLASDQDDGVISYAITAGNDLGAFRLNETNGELFVDDATVLSLEVSPVFNLTVEVFDGIASDAGIITVNLKRILALNDELSEALTISPSPAADLIAIKGKYLLNRKVDIQLVNLSGIREAVDVEKIGSTYQIKVEGLASGVYFIVLDVGNERISKKVIKR